ncbi:MAG: hypothetical protein GXW85_05745 [Clostridia bacterium]|nr:hypothetical protein [Clostridia bacterium]
MKKIVAVFTSRNRAENAAEELRQAGFDKEISVVTKGNDNDGNRRNDNGMTMGTGDSIADGTTTGASLGALGGLALGAGALAIPGIGPLVAAGPIAAALTGAAAGGLGGALIDMGIPEADSKRYEEDIKQGKTLVAVECSDDKSKKAQEILRQNGADSVKLH